MRMIMSVEFDRSATREHYISPGGYEVIAAGKNYQFDFLESIGMIDKKNPKVIHFECNYADLDSFPEMEELKKHLHEITDFIEFYVYTGEYDDPEIIPVKAMAVCIETTDAEYIVPETETDFIRIERCNELVQCYFKSAIDLMK